MRLGVGLYPPTFFPTLRCSRGRVCGRVCVYVCTLHLQRCIFFVELAFSSFLLGVLSSFLQSVVRHVCRPCHVSIMSGFHFLPSPSELTDVKLTSSSYYFLSSEVFSFWKLFRQRCATHKVHMQTREGRLFILSIGGHGRAGNGGFGTKGSTKRKRCHRERKTHHSITKTVCARYGDLCGGRKNRTMHN